MLDSYRVAPSCTRTPSRRSRERLSSFPWGHQSSSSSSWSSTCTRTTIQWDELVTSIMDHNGILPAPSYRQWLADVGAWLDVTAGRLTPTAQAAPIQIGVRGMARTYALSIPPQAITFGTVINGVNTDPVTYLLFCLVNRFEILEDERPMASGMQVLDFRATPNERVDNSSSDGTWPDMKQKCWSRCSQLPHPHNDLDEGLPCQCSPDDAVTSASQWTNASRSTAV